VTPTSTLAPAAPAPRVEADRRTAGNVQLASLSQETVSDGTSDIPDSPASVRQAGSRDLGIAAQAVQTAQVELLPPPPVNGYKWLSTAVQYSPSDTLEMDIDRNLQQIVQQSNPTFDGGLGFRWHDGTSGLNQLTEFGVPLEATFSPWYTGTVRIDVLPVYLDAGSISAGNLNQFGVNPILSARGLASISPGDQNAGGVGLLGGYSYGDLSGEIGTTPLGFPVTNIVGMAAFAPKFLDNNLTVRFQGLRQPVTDSVLSYAGTHTSLSAANAVTGGAFGPSGTWGGVVKTGVNVSAFYDDTIYGAYASAGLATVTGHNVQDNSQIDGLAGAYFRPYKTEDAAVRVGISFYYTGFDRNLSGFTFGQGGYFSPQNFEALTFPVEYTGKSGPWTYLAAAAIGVQHFNADGSAIFPNNLNAQLALASSPGAFPISPGTSSTGPAINVKGQLEYAIDDSTSIGAAVSFNNGNNYNEVIGRLYLRKTFDWLSPIASGSDPTAIARRDQPQSRL
jgi:cellulose synthase operon protein C